MGTPLEVAKEVAVAALLLGASFGLGVWLLLPFREVRKDPLGPLAALALGMGALGYLTFFLGLVRVEKEVSLTLTLFGLLLLALGIGKGLTKSCGRPWTKIASLLREAPHFVLPLALMALAAFLSALSPPTDWDGLSYHLAVPMRYLMAGRIHYIPDIHHSNFPSTFGMLYMLALSLEGLSAPKLLHFAAFLTCSLMAGLWAVEASNDTKAGLWAAAFLFSAPVAVWEAGVAYIDLGLALFETMALYSLWRGARAKEGGWLPLAAIFSGLAGGTKITGLLCGLLLLPVVFLISPKGRRVKETLTFGAIFLIVASPWYLRSLIWTGNPVYPFAYEIFGGRNWDSFCAKMYDRSLKDYGMGREVSALLLLPWNLTFHAEKFGDGGFLILTLGPLFLALLPATLFGATRRGRGTGLLRGALLYILVRGLLWFKLSQQSRFLLPLLPLGVVACSIGARKAFRRRLSTLAAEALFVAVLLVHGVVFLLSSSPALTADREKYLSKVLDIYPVEKRLNQWLPEGAKVLFLGETRGFYLRRRYMWGDEGHHTLLRYSKMRSPEELYQRLRTLGITHILVNLNFAPTFLEERDAMSRLFMALLREGRMRPLLGIGRIFVFEFGGEGGGQ